MEFVFILVEPAVPENIGAAARAIKTMGFKELRLINTNKHLCDEATWLAHGSTDILNEAKVYTHLKEAIVDLDFLIGTTAKKRSVKKDYYTPEETQAILEVKKDSVNRIGVIFGREESGLTNEELDSCDIALSIPLMAPYPSINLAQSVMIVSYVLSNCVLKHNNRGDKKNNYLLLKKKTKNILNSIDIIEGENLHGRIMERFSKIGADDINLFLSMIARIEKKLNIK